MVMSASDIPHFGIVSRNFRKIEDIVLVTTLPTAVIEDASLYRSARRPDDTHYRTGQHALAAAALAHHSQHDPGANVETDAVHGAHRSLVEKEVSLEVPDAEQWVLAQFSVPLVLSLPIAGFVLIGLRRIWVCCVPEPIPHEVEGKH